MNGFCCSGKGSLKTLKATIFLNFLAALCFLGASGGFEKKILLLLGVIWLFIGFLNLYKYSRNRLR